MSAENPEGHAETPLEGFSEWRLDLRGQWTVGLESELYWEGKAELPTDHPFVPESSREAT